jgi:hypothetical protein
MPTVDILYSTITFQHNPPPLSLFIIRKLLNKLSNNGVAYFQIPTFKSGYIFEAERYLFSSPKGDMEMHYLPQYYIYDAIQNSSCVCLEVREDGFLDEDDFAISNQFLVKKIIRNS